MVSFAARLGPWPWKQTGNAPSLMHLAFHPSPQYRVLRTIPGDLFWLLGWETPTGQQLDAPPYYRPCPGTGRPYFIPENVLLGGGNGTGNGRPLELLNLGQLSRMAQAMMATTTTTTFSSRCSETLGAVFVVDLLQSEGNPLIGVLEAFFERSS